MQIKCTFFIKLTKKQYDEVQMYFVSLPANGQGGFCGVDCPSEAGVFSDVGQGHHTVVVRDQDDINGGQIQQFSLGQTGEKVY